MGKWRHFWILRSQAQSWRHKSVWSMKKASLTANYISIKVFKEWEAFPYTADRSDGAAPIALSRWQSPDCTVSYLFRLICLPQTWPFYKHFSKRISTLVNLCTYYTSISNVSSAMTAGHVISRFLETRKLCRELQSEIRSTHRSID